MLVAPHSIPSSMPLRTKSSSLPSRSPKQPLVLNHRTCRVLHIVHADFRSPGVLGRSRNGCTGDRASVRFGLKL